MDPQLNTAPCGYLLFGDDGTMLEVNATLAELLGYTRFELEGWHLQKILAPGGRVFYHTHIFPLLKLHGTAEEIYIALRTKDGADLPMLMNGVRRERGGGPVNECVLMRMTQRNRFEEELLAARRAAEQANAAKAKFLSMMSHDLRTPLTAISGLGDLLAAGAHGPVTEEQLDALARMKGASRELLRMINDILTFAQLEYGRVEVRPSPVRMADALARAEVLVRLRVESSGLSLRFSACDAEVVSADADKLQQILLNLLTNAIKFTPRGGTISVGCERDGTRVRIRIADTGIGIPPDQLPTVFEPFVQLEEQPEDVSQRGVGLGLAISRDLARAMGGELTADSSPGEGSVFTVELPAV
jgi:PAS domain S-box-containing protein